MFNKNITLYIIGMFFCLWSENSLSTETATSLQDYYQKGTTGFKPKVTPPMDKKTDLSDNKPLQWDQRRNMLYYTTENKSPNNNQRKSHREKNGSSTYVYEEK